MSPVTAMSNTKSAKSAAVPHTVAPKQQPSSKPKTSGKRVTHRGAKPAPSDGSVPRDYVQVAAYYIAQRRGFPGGSELQDWLEAEREIEALLQT